MYVEGHFYRSLWLSVEGGIAIWQKCIQPARGGSFQLVFDVLRIRIYV